MKIPTVPWAGIFLLAWPAVAGTPAGGAQWTAAAELRRIAGEAGVRIGLYITVDTASAAAPPPIVVNDFAASLEFQSHLTEDGGPLDLTERLFGEDGRLETGRARFIARQADGHPLQVYAFAPVIELFWPQVLAVSSFVCLDPGAAVLGESHGHFDVAAIRACTHDGAHPEYFQFGRYCAPTARAGVCEVHVATFHFDTRPTTDGTFSISMALRSGPGVASLPEGLSLGVDERGARVEVTLAGGVATDAGEPP